MTRIIACVYRTGGVFTREWVFALKRGLNRTAPGVLFRVLTNDYGLTPLWRIPLEHDWPGWWSKFELFRPGVFPEGARVLYLDLDTLPIGDLSDLLNYDGPFAMLSDFYRPGAAASGVMSWRVGTGEHALYEQLVRGGVTSAPSRSDPYYRKVLGNRIVFLQDRFPGQIVSYKKHARNGPPKGARLVCGHGRPRFSDRAAGWAHDQWRSLARGGAAA